MEKKQASKFYPHFNENERPTIDYLVGLLNRLIYKEETILTDFLDPGKLDILKVIVGNDAFIQTFGGYKNAEKRRAFLSKEWINLKPQDYQITPYEIEYPQKFSVLSHGSILGTLANSGIKTEMFGDIITDDNGIWQFFGDSELNNFFEQQIERIGRVKVKIHPINCQNVLEPHDNSIEKIEIVPSMRLDAVIAGISKKSRSQIKLAIAAREIKLNWHDVTNSNIMVKVDDVLSLRHFGRVQIIDILTTKKGKYKVVLKFWQTHKKI